MLESGLDGGIQQNLWYYLLSQMHLYLLNRRIGASGGGGGRCDGFNLSLFEDDFLSSLVGWYITLGFITLAK